MNRNKALLVIVLVTLLVAVAPSFALAQSKPNIVLIVTDDYGWGDARVYGGCL